MEVKKTIVFWLILLSLVYTIQTTGKKKLQKHHNQNDSDSEQQEDMPKPEEMIPATELTSEEIELYESLLRRLLSCQKPFKEIFYQRNILRDFKPGELRIMREIVGCRSTKQVEGLSLFPFFEMNRATLVELRRLLKFLIDLASRLTNTVKNLVENREEQPKNEQIAEILYLDSRLLFVSSNDLKGAEAILKSDQTQVNFFKIEIVKLLIQLAEYLSEIQFQLSTLRMLFIRLDRSQSYFKEETKFTKYTELLECRSRNLQNYEFTKARRTHRLTLLPFKKMKYSQVSHKTDEEAKQILMSEKKRIEKKRTYRLKDGKTLGGKALSDLKKESTLSEYLQEKAREEEEQERRRQQEEEEQELSEEEERNPLPTRSETVIRLMERRKSHDKAPEVHEESGFIQPSVTERPTQFRRQRPSTLSEKPPQEERGESSSKQSKQDQASKERTDTERPVSSTSQYFIVEAVRADDISYLQNLITVLNHWEQTCITYMGQSHLVVSEEQMRNETTKIEEFLRLTNAQQLMGQLNYMTWIGVQEHIIVSDLVVFLLNRISQLGNSLVHIESELKEIRDSFLSQILTLRQVRFVQFRREMEQQRQQQRSRKRNVPEEDESSSGKKKKRKKGHDDAN